jgi:predicted 3-demethylubiquinone-9 3-methyltransferase (glyoxalase superfamily)
MQKITPFLWFDSQAEEAAAFYVSIFKNSRILGNTRFDDVPEGPTEIVTVVRFELEGQAFTALNGGPMFQFTPAISFYVACETQAEVDYYWERLLEGGQPEQCGWLRDKFGVSWQIIPTALEALLLDPEPDKAKRVMDAMLKMEKIDITTLERACKGQRPQR